MTMFSAEEYTSCKKWIAQKIQEGYSWEDVEHLCVPENQAAQEFDYLQMEELVFPPNLEFSEWPELVKSVRSSYTPITDLYGLSGGTSNT